MSNGVYKNIEDSPQFTIRLFGHIWVSFFDNYSDKTKIFITFQNETKYISVKYDIEGDVFLSIDNEIYDSKVYKLFKDVIKNYLIVCEDNIKICNQIINKEK